jgi:hypothetical protein
MVDLRVVATHRRRRGGLEARTIERRLGYWKFIPSPSGYLQNRYPGFHARGQADQRREPFSSAPIQVGRTYSR